MTRADLPEQCNSVQVPDLQRLCFKLVSVTLVVARRAVTVASAMRLCARACTPASAAAASPPDGTAPSASAIASVSCRAPASALPAWLAASSASCRHEMSAFASARVGFPSLILRRGGRQSAERTWPMRLRLHQLVREMHGQCVNAPTCCTLHPRVRHSVKSWSIDLPASTLGMHSLTSQAGRPAGQGSNWAELRSARRLGCQQVSHSCQRSLPWGCVV